jgi:uncharacterized FlgJ-related protein
MLEFKKETLTFLETENNYQKPFYISIVVSFILILSLCFAFKLLVKQNEIINENKLIKSQIEWHNEKTMSQIDSLIDLIPFSNKQLVKYQYRLECGNLTSNIFKTNNNLFGTKNAGKRPQLGRKSKLNDYRHYDNLILSIFDRYLYELYYGTKLKNYSEDENYKKKLENF